MVDLSPSEIDIKVKSSLEGTPYEASTLTPLAGGSVNYTYAATLAKPLDDGTKQVLVKHAETHMKVRPDTALSLDRAHGEIECFKRLSERHLHGPKGQGDPHSITVRTPKYYHFDEANANQLLEFMPQGITLKDYVLKYFALSASESSDAEARKIGKAIGSWLKGFTQWAAGHVELHALAEKNEQGRFFRHLVTFGWLKDRVEQYYSALGDAKEVFVEVEKAVTAELEDPSKVQVIHGDFWTGNLLLPDAPMPQGDHNATLFVVDWEMVHLNVPNVDFGQMIAEFYFFWLFKSIPAGLWMLEAMIDAYGQVTEDFAYRTAIQVGAHLVCVITDLNRVSPEQLEKAAIVGKDIILHAWNKDRAWFEEGDLACVFRQVR